MDSTAFSSVESSCQDGDLSSVKSLLPSLRQQSTDLDADLKALFITACQHAKADIASYLLTQGAKWDQHLPIIIGRRAKSDQYIPIFQLFLDNGWDINTDHHGFGTALFRAIANRNIALVRYLLANGADANMEAFQPGAKTRMMHSLPGTAHGMKPLDSAASRGCVEIIRVLLDHGAILEDANPLHKAAAEPCASEAEDDSRIQTMEFLITEKDMDINALQSFTPGSSAIPSNGRPAVLATPLHYAARWQNESRVKFLLEHGADPTKQASDGGTPLEWAIAMNDEETGGLDPEIETLLREALT